MKDIYNIYKCGIQNHISNIPLSGSFRGRSTAASASIQFPFILAGPLVFLLNGVKQFIGSQFYYKT